MKQMKRMLKRGGSALMVMAMLAVTIAGASAQVQAFSLFGFEVGGGDSRQDNTVVKENTEELEQARAKRAAEDGDYREKREQQERGIERANEAIETNMPQDTQERVRERVNAREAIDNLNQRKGMQAELKGFEGDVFCVVTDERTVNMAITQEGALEIVNGTPEDCYEIKTSEAFLSSAYDRIQANQYVSKDELKANADMPWGLRTKITYHLLKRSMFS